MANKVIRILLADDEATIAKIYANVLPLQFSHDTGTAAELEEELFGPSENDSQPVDITVCRQGDEALHVAFESIRDGRPFDVIVLDICMPPGIDGVETAKMIRAKDPSVAILFVSGYSDYTLEELEAIVPPPSRLGFMAKPVQLGALAQRITALAGPGT